MMKTYAVEIHEPNRFRVEHGEGRPGREARRIAHRWRSRGYRVSIAIFRDGWVVARWNLPEPKLKRT